MGVSRGMRNFVYRRDGGRCFYCTALVTYGDATLDHRVPRSQGGLTNAQNLVLCCRVCNEAKGDRSEQEWLAMPKGERRRLLAAKRRQLRWRESAERAEFVHQMPQDGV